MDMVRFKELDYSVGQDLTPHTHKEGQIIFARAGCMEVKAGNQLLILPSSRIVWIPPNVTHSICFRSSTKMRTAFISSSLLGKAFDQVIALQASDLFRAVLIRLAEEDNSDKYYRNLLQDTFIQELNLLKSEPFSIDFPTDSRAQKVAQALLENPSSSFKIQDWANMANCSAKTLGRLFIKDTGLSFQLWRRHMRLLLTHEKLESGLSVTKAAHEVGFATSSVLTEAHTQTFGYPPTHLLKYR